LVSALIGLDPWVTCPVLLPHQQRDRRRLVAGLAAHGLQEGRRPVGLLPVTQAVLGLFAHANERPDRAVSATPRHLKLWRGLSPADRQAWRGLVRVFRSVVPRLNADLEA
jgi:hypothetical protein